MRHQQQRLILMMIVFVIVILAMTCVASCTGLHGKLEPSVDANAVVGLSNKLDMLDVKVGDLSSAVTKVYNGDPWYQDLGQQAMFTAAILAVSYVGYLSVKMGYSKLQAVRKNGSGRKNGRKTRGSLR